MGNKRFEKAMKRLRATAPTTGIEAAYENLGARNRPVKRLKGVILYSGLAAAVPALLLCLLFLFPKPAEAVSLQEIADALKGAETVHLERFRVLTGNEADGESYYESWRQGEKFRIRSGFSNLNTTGIEVHVYLPSDSGFDGKRAWRVDHSDKSVVIGTLQWAEKKKPENLDDYIERYISVARENPKISRSVKNGIETIVFQAHSKLDYSPFRYEITVDQETKHILKEKKINLTTQGKWVLRNLVRFSYPKNIDDSFFAPHVPAGYMVYDNFKVLDNLKAAFSGDAPKRVVEGVEITLLGAFQEKDGRVRILWTGGAAPPLFAEAAVFDTKGKQELASFWHEADDRTRERNYGVPPKDPPKQIPAADRIVKLRPMGFYKEQPYYCLRINPGPIEGNASTTYNVVLPVCKQVEPYIQQPGQYMKHESTGKQVGVATFRVTTTPVVFWDFEIIKLLDPDRMPSSSYYGTTNIGMSAEQRTTLQKELEERKRSGRTIVIGG